MTFDDDDDWAHDDLISGLIAFGPVAIDPIFKGLKKDLIFPTESFGLAGLTEVLTDIAKAHDHERERVAAFLRELLSSFECLPPRLNSFIVCGLIDLGDNQAAPIIQKVFERKFLDEQVVDWAYIREKIPEANLPEKIKLDLYKPNEFHYSGDANFRKVLKALGATTNVDELKCLMVGSFLAVDMVQPSELLSQVIDEAEEEEDGGFQSDGQASYFYREFFGLWNELAECQNKLFSLPKIVQIDLNDLSDRENAMMKIFWTKLHLIAFNQGLAMGNTDTDRFSGTTIGDFIEYTSVRKQALKGNSFPSLDFSS